MTELEKFFFGEGAQLPPDFVARRRRSERCRRHPPRLLLRARPPTAAPRLAAGRSSARAGFDARAIDLLARAARRRRARARRAAGRHLGADAHRAAPRRRGRARVASVKPRRAHLLLRALRAAQRGAPARARRRLGHRRRVRGGARRARARSARRAGRPTSHSRCAGWQLRRAGCATALPPARPLRAAGRATARRRASPATSRRAAAACTCCRHLPDPAGLRRPLLRRAAATSSSPTCAPRSPPARATSPSAIPISSTAPARAGGRRARSTRRIPDVTFDVTIKVEHILKHRDALPRAGRARLRLRGLAPSSRVSDAVLRHPRQGPHARRRRAALEILRDAGIPLRPTLVAVHAVDDARRLPRAARLRSPSTASRHVDPVQLRFACSCRRGRCCSTIRRLAPHLGALDPARFSYAWTHPDPRMDRLCDEVSGARRAAHSREAAARGDLRRGLRAGGAGGGCRGLRAAGRSGKSPPHLSEPWFCCAEPTRGQLNKLSPT